MRREYIKFGASVAAVGGLYGLGLYLEYQEKEKLKIILKIKKIKYPDLKGNDKSKKVRYYMSNYKLKELKKLLEKTKENA